MNRLHSCLLGAAIFMTSTSISIPQELPGQTLGKMTVSGTLHNRGAEPETSPGAITYLSTRFRLASALGPEGVN